MVHSRIAHSLSAVAAIHANWNREFISWFLSRPEASPQGEGHAFRPPSIQSLLGQYFPHWRGLGLTARPSEICSQ